MGICSMMDIVVATAGSDIDQFVREAWTYMLCDLTSRVFFKTWISLQNCKKFVVQKKKAFFLFIYRRNIFKS